MVWASSYSFLLYIWHTLTGLCGVGKRVFILGKRHLTCQRVLGEGGFGTVFEVIDSTENRAYALKEIRASRVDVEREISAHNSVRHKNVVPLIDYVIEVGSNGQTIIGQGGKRRGGAANDIDEDMTTTVIDIPGSPPRRRALIPSAANDDTGLCVHALFLFPLFQSGTLHDAIVHALNNTHHHHRSGETPIFIGEALCERDAALICAGAARGLAALHAAGFSHRDVNPRNILVTRGNGVFSSSSITDLGSAVTPVIQLLPSRHNAARVEEEAETRTSAPFRSPELWSCEYGAIPLDGAAADAWALGCTLFAAIIGVSPFECVAGAGGTLIVCESSHLRVLGPPIWPTSHGTKISPAFKSIVMALLSRDPKSRLTVTEAAVALEKLL